MHLNFEWHMKQQYNGEVCTFAHSNYIEVLFMLLKYYVKHVYNTVPRDGREVDYLMESVFRRNIASLLLKERKDYVRRIFASIERA